MPWIVCYTCKRVTSSDVSFLSECACMDNKYIQWINGTEHFIFRLHGKSSDTFLLCSLTDPVFIHFYYMTNNSLEQTFLQNVFFCVCVPQKNESHVFVMNVSKWGHFHVSYSCQSCVVCVMCFPPSCPHLWPWSTKPVLSRWGIFMHC